MNFFHSIVSSEYNFNHLVRLFTFFASHGCFVAQRMPHDPRPQTEPSPKIAGDLAKTLVERKRRLVVSLAAQSLSRPESCTLLVIRPTIRKSDELHSAHRKQDQKGQMRRVRANVSKVYQHQRAVCVMATGHSLDHLPIRMVLRKVASRFCRRSSLIESRLLDRWLTSLNIVETIFNFPGRELFSGSLSSRRSMCRPNRRSR